VLLVLAVLVAILSRLAGRPVMWGATVMGTPCLYLLLGMLSASVYAAIGQPYLVTIVAATAGDLGRERRRHRKEP